MIDEIKHAIKKFNPQCVDFADETFTFPKDRALKICEIMIKEGLSKKLKWTVQSRVTLVDQELFNKMKEAGCVRVDFGIESGNQQILKIIRKGITKIDASKAIDAAKKAGLKTGSYFIIGPPFETSKTIRDTIDFAAKLNTTTVSFGIMVPYPGTEVHEMAIREEGGYRLISKRWQDYDKQFGNALELDNLSRQEMEKWQRRAYFIFYFRNYRFFDLVKLAFLQRRLLWRMVLK